VRREAIVEDYTLTNTAVDLRCQLLGREGTGAGLAATAEPILALSATAQEAMLAARPEYILASLGAIEARHGSVRQYLLDELALEPALLERLRERLLT
jgi:protein tyrosine/serine phosphatase